MKTKIRVLFVFLLTMALQALAQDPLPLQPNATTEAVDSKHFLEYAGTPTVDHALSLPANVDKVPFVLTRVADGETPAGGMPDGSLTKWLATKAANADLVIVGTPLRRHSALTADRSFVFSEYQVQIDDILKDSSGAVSPGRTIVVARPGGVTEVDGRVVRGIDPDFHLFHLDAPYVLFLKSIPDAGTFKAYADGSFLISDGKVISGKTHPEKMAESLQDDRTFLNNVREAIALAKKREVRK